MKDQSNKWHQEKSKIIPCTCKHAFQDSQYGMGRRVHNPFARGYRCTVCKNEKT